MTTPLPLTVSLPWETADELVRDFAPRVSGDVVFLPEIDGPLLGARVKAELTLKGGEVALSFWGAVSWRYPVGAAPLGRDAGVAILVEGVAEPHRELLERLRRATGAGSGAQAPGARLGAPALRPRRAVVEVVVQEEPRQARLDDGFEIRTSDFVLAEHEERLLATEGAPRPLPPPEGFFHGPVPRPALSGAFFMFENKPVGGFRFVEPFEWALIGTLRPTKRDMRTWLDRDDERRDDERDYPSLWDEVTDSQRERARIRHEEVSDPSSKVDAVVEGALRGVAEVDDALLSSPAARPAKVSEGDEEVTETDLDPLRTESSEAPEAQLADGLRLRIDDGRAEELFAAGIGIPARTTKSLAKPANGAATIKLAVFEGALAGQGRHVGTLKVPVPRGDLFVEVRFDVTSDAFVEVRSLADGSVRDRFRTSWAAPVRLPARRRGASLVKKLLKLFG